MSLRALTAAEAASDLAGFDAIIDARAPAEVADQFDATIVWMHENPLLPGRRYLLKIGAVTVPAQPVWVDTFTCWPPSSVSVIDDSAFASWRALL